MRSYGRSLPACLPLCFLVYLLVCLFVCLSVELFGGLFLRCFALLCFMSFVHSLMSRACLLKHSSLLACWLACFRDLCACVLFVLVVMPCVWHHRAGWLGVTITKHARRPQRDRQTSSQTDKRTDGQTLRQASNKQTDRQTRKHKQRDTHHTKHAQNKLLGFRDSFQGSVFCLERGADKQITPPSGLGHCLQSGAQTGRPSQ